MTLPTVAGSAVGFMARDTPTHGHRLYLSRHRHLPEIAMTSGTHRRHGVHGKLLYQFLVIEDEFLEVLFVGEMNEIGHVVHLLPWNGLALFPILGELLNARLVGGYHTVAAHALAGGWDAGHLAAAAVAVAVETVDLVDLGMDVVRELDGLFDHVTVVVARRGNRIFNSGAFRRSSARPNQEAADTQEGQ